MFSLRTFAFTYSIWLAQIHPISATFLCTFTKVYLHQVITVGLCAMIEDVVKGVEIQWYEHP